MFDSLSKKQEMVGRLTPKVVVTDLSSFFSSVTLLCWQKVKTLWDTLCSFNLNSRLKNVEMGKDGAFMLDQISQYSDQKDKQSMC